MVDMACMFPFSVANPLYPLPGQTARIPVPCGRCPECVRRRVNEWSFRLQEEERHYASSLFVTLTYERPPMTDNGFMTLCKAHWQQFMKALRFSYAYRGVDSVTGRTKWMYDKVPQMKYYLCGEYGSKLFRPHYHAILFGYDRNALADLWQGFDFVDSSTGEVLATGGTVDIGTVTGASIGYTLKYLAKGKIVPVHSRDDRVPEFTMMSKGLGKGYLTAEGVEYHRSGDGTLFLRNPDGFTIGMPRYYKDKIWTKQERRKYAANVAELHERNEAARRARYKKRHGSMDGYDESIHKAKKAAIDNMRAAARSKRKDL